MLIKYWASATASGAPVIVMVLSEEPLSRSSQFEMRIMAPEICLISAILVPPLPMTQPINSFGTVISVVCWLVFCWVRVFELRNWEPAKAARAKKLLFSKIDFCVILHVQYLHKYYSTVGGFVIGQKKNTASWNRALPTNRAVIYTNTADVHGFMINASPWRHICSTRSVHIIFVVYYDGHDS